MKFCSRSLKQAFQTVKLHRQWKFVILSLTVSNFYIENIFLFGSYLNYYSGMVILQLIWILFTYPFFILILFVEQHQMFNWDGYGAKWNNPFCCLLWFIHRSRRSTRRSTRSLNSDVSQLKRASAGSNNMQRRSLRVHNKSSQSPALKKRRVSDRAQSGGKKSTPVTTAKPISKSFIPKLTLPSTPTFMK